MECAPGAGRAKRLLAVASNLKARVMLSLGYGCGRAFLHLSYSYAPPCGPALLVTQCQERSLGDLTQSDILLDSA